MMFLMHSSCASLLFTFSNLYYVHFCDPVGELLITIFGNWQVEIGKHDIEYFIILYISQTPSRTNIHVQ